VVSATPCRPLPRGSMAGSTSSRYPPAVGKVKTGTTGVPRLRAMKAGIGLVRERRPKKGTAMASS